MSRALVVAALATALLAGCGAGAPSPSPGGPLPVVASTTVFADLVANVGGDLVSVSSIVPRNGDVHTYSPTPNDARLIASARLAFMNGFGLDDWLDERIRDIGATAEIVALAPGLPGAEVIGGEDEPNPNPHLWLDVSYAEGYVDRIADALTRADPAHTAAYESNADAYRRRLAGLDAEVRAEIATIPEASRRIVSFHDSLPYFARAYGLTIVGVAVEAPGQEPSAAEIGRLVAAVEAAHVRAIFSEAQFPARLLDQIATETGAKVVATLYDDALGDPPVTSYEALIRWDADQIVEALR